MSPVRRMKRRRNVRRAAGEVAAGGKSSWIHDAVVVERELLWYAIDRYVCVCVAGEAGCVCDIRYRGLCGSNDEFFKVFY